MEETFFEQPIKKYRENWLKITSLSLFGLIILLGVAYAGYWWGSQKVKLESSKQTSPNLASLPTPTSSIQDETANWNIYKDDWGIVEFRYPSSVKFNASVIVFVPPDNFETWLAKHPSPQTGPKTQVLLSSEDLNIGQLKGKKRIFNVTLGETNPQTGKFETKKLKHTEVVLTDGKKLLVIDFGWNFGNEEREQKIINKITSTVKFFEVSINIPDWKTYQNKKYGFQLQYPPNYLVKEEEKNSKPYIVISNPEKENLSELDKSYSIFIFPRESSTALKNILGLPLPILASEEYFISNRVKAGLNTYLRSITIDKRVGFQLIHSEMTDIKYTLFKNPDGSWFTISSQLNSLIPYSKKTMIEPYDSIIGSLKFTQ